jgi:YYY domain-containing protein
MVAYGFGRWDRYRRFNWPFLRDVGLTGGLVAILGFLLYLPFYIGFQSQAGGLLPTLYVGTRFRQYFVMFGPFLAALAGMLILMALRLRPEMPGRRLLVSWLAWTATFILVPLGIMVMILLLLVLTPQGRELLEGIRRVPAVYELVGDAPWGQLLVELLLVKLRTWVMPLVVAGMAGLGTLLLQRSAVPSPDPDPGAEGEKKGARHHPSVQFVLIIAVIGLLLTLSVEFFYLVDNFRVRMNTIFKFYFQAWVLMAVASAFAVYWLSRRGEGRDRAHKAGRVLFLTAFWILFVMGMVYPVLGNIRRAEDFANPPRLDGTAYLLETQAHDYAAVAWLNENVAGAPVILEKPGAGGSSYVYEGRVSAQTGLPTLLGWAGHEGQWRGDYTVQAAREPDIEMLYNTLDLEAALTLLDKYDITYVYVGLLERSEYDPRGLEKFGLFMDIVYENEGVTIYKRR